jgi:hypothetical protein
MSTQITGATGLVKSFGKTKKSEPGSTFLSNINMGEMHINGADFDIVRGMLEADHNVSSEVKDVLSVLMLEAAKGLNISVTELVKLGSINPNKISIPEVGLDMINQLRPITSQIGMKTVNAKASDVAYIDRNIIS